jgi:predicted MFS family arabinose efflux permease
VEPEASPGVGAMLRSLARPAVLIGVWVFTLPALFSGVVEVLVPLRLDDLGVGGATIGLVFLLSAAVEGVVSPIAGRASDRSGRIAPIRFGLTGAVIMALVLPLPRTAVLVGLCVMLTYVALGAFWAPGMAMLSDAAEDAGLDQALAFATSNFAWALGHVFGAGLGGAVADATSDTVPYAALAVLCATTLAGLTLNRRGQEAFST